MNVPAKYWFPAKKRGWGWGMPTAWQGRAALAVFGLLVAAGAVILLPARGAGAFVPYCAGLCVLLMILCWFTGEPPGTNLRKKDS